MKVYHCPEDIVTLAMPNQKQTDWYIVFTKFDFPITPYLDK